MTVEVLSPQLMMPADIAHRRLAKALQQIEADYWAAADEMHAAYESEAWLRDDRAHEARYRMIMRDHNLRSIFFAYCFDEFGLREAYAGYLAVAGRLRAEVNPSTVVEGLNWSRFTLRSVRPIGAAILNGYEAEVVAGTLVAASDLAAAESAKKPRPGHADHERAPVTSRHVRKALEERGLVPPRSRSTIGDESKAEREERQLAQAAERLTASGDLLLDADDTEPVITAVMHFIRRLSDNPKAIRRIRKALE